MTTCGVCGAKNPRGAKRCGNCGALLPPTKGTGRGGTLVNIPSPLQGKGSPPPPDVTPVVPATEPNPPTPRTPDPPTQIADPVSYDEHPETAPKAGGGSYTTPVADSTHLAAPVEPGYPQAAEGSFPIADPISHDGYPEQTGAAAGYPAQQRSSQPGPSQQGQSGYPPTNGSYPAPPSPRTVAQPPPSPTAPATAPGAVPTPMAPGPSAPGPSAPGVPAPGTTPSPTAPGPSAPGPTGTPANGTAVARPIALNASSQGLPVPAPPPLPTRHGTGNQPAVSQAHLAEHTPTLSDSVTPARGTIQSEEATPPHGAQLPPIPANPVPNQHELFPAGGQVQVPPGMMAGQSPAAAMTGEHPQAHAGSPAPHLAGSYAGGSMPSPVVNPNQPPKHRLLAAAGGRIMAVHPGTGRVMWWSQLAHIGHTIYDLQVHGELLFALVSSGLMFCMDHATGRTRWTATLSPGTNATLQVTDSAVYVTHGEQLDCINMHGWRLWSMALQGVGVQNAKIVFA